MTRLGARLALRRLPGRRKCDRGGRRRGALGRLPIRHPDPRRQQFHARAAGAGVNAATRHRGTPDAASAEVCFPLRKRQATQGAEMRAASMSIEEAFVTYSEGMTLAATNARPGDLGACRRL